MKKKIIIGLVALMVLALAIPAYAAATNTQVKEINDLWNQIFELRKQMVEKYVDAGKLTKEQGDAVKKNIDQENKYRQENPDSAYLGSGCAGSANGTGGAGSGMMGGAGYGMMGGTGNGMMGGYSGYSGASAGTVGGQTI